MLVFKISNYLFVYNKDIINDAQRFLNVNNEIPALINFVNDDTSKKMIYIHNHYRFANIPLDWISALFYNEDEYKNRGYYPTDRIFEKKQLDNYFIKCPKGSTAIGVWLCWENNWMQFGELNYNAKKGKDIVPTYYHGGNFIIGHNDYITKRMSVYYDKMHKKYLDFLKENKKEASDNRDTANELKELLFNEFGEMLWRYNELIPSKVDKAIVIDLNKVSEITNSEYYSSSGNELRKRIIVGHITPVKPEKSYEDLRKEYFEKKALKLLEENKSKRRRKPSDKKSDSKTDRKTRGTTKSVNDSA